MSLIFDLLAFRQTSHHLYVKLFGNVCGEYHLTQIEMDVLLFLANNPEFQTATDIVSVRHLAKSQVSMAVDKLAKAGYLLRKNDERNQRRMLLSITPAAQPIVERGRECQQRFGQELLRDVSEDELQTMNAVMEKLLHNVRTAYEEQKDGEKP